MDWSTIWNGFVGMVSALAVVGTLFGVIEGLFKPVRGAIEKRDRRMRQETKIAESLERLDAHFKEAERLDEQIEGIEETLEKHERQIEYSREERQILWQGMRAILQALRPLVPEDSSIVKALADMDEYANRQMRK